MGKEVTLRGLNKEFMKSLISSKMFWASFILYLIGLFILIFNPLVSGIIMFIAAVIMINVDYNSRKKVVKNLMWKK